MQTLRDIFVIVAGVVVLFVMVFFLEGSVLDSNTKTAEIMIGDERLSVVTARTPEERHRGLSGLEAMPEDGMLFVFDAPGLHGIWMPDMRFSIDIVWVHESGAIVWIEERVSPETYPTTVFYPPEPAAFVLELPSGWIERNGITPDMSVSIQ